MRGMRVNRLLAAVAAAGLLMAVSPAPRAAALGGPNLAAGKATSASSSHDAYPAGNVTDGDQGTYWESANNAFPHPRGTGQRRRHRVLDDRRLGRVRLQSRLE